MKKTKIVEWFLRISISIGFLSAVADRFGLWGQSVSAWGNWEAFATYTNKLLPFLSHNMASIFGGIATALELILGLLLLTNIKSSSVSFVSGVLLLIFGLTMTFSLGIKAPFDYSVYTASAAAFGLNIILCYK